MYSCHFRQALKHKSKFEIQLDLKEPNHESVQKKPGGSCFATRYHAESCCYNLKGSNKPTWPCAWLTLTRLIHIWVIDYQYST